MYNERSYYCSFGKLLLWTSGVFAVLCLIGFVTDQTLLSTWGVLALSAFFFVVLPLLVLTYRYLTRVSVGPAGISAPSCFSEDLSRHEADWEEMESVRYTRFLFFPCILVRCPTRRVWLTVSLWTHPFENFSEHVITCAPPNNPLRLAVEEISRRRAGVT